MNSVWFFANHNVYTLFLDKPSLSNLVKNSLRRLTRNSYILPFEYLIITFLLDIA